MATVSRDGRFKPKDRLSNTGQAPVTIYRCHSRWTLAPGHYEVYAQNSRWSNENQGAWIPLHTGTLEFSSDWGRSTENGTPYACVRETGGDCGLAFHILPRGNWVMRISARALSNQRPCAVIELGLADEDLRWNLAPGEVLDLPEILVQNLPGGEPHLAAPALHRYITSRLPAPAKPEIPVIYNTWFDQSDRLDVARLCAQLRAAREIGCEIFVVDAGWFGPDDAGWGHVGDWREKTDRAFHGNMRAFADEVRAAGLQFGLWMEPERAVPGIPVRREHPDWFFPGEIRYNLEIKAARDYLFGEIARLITTYSLAWIKLDYNVSLGFDASGAELYRHLAIWNAMLDELRHKYPHTVFENCSSGGMRLDLSSLFHYDVHFISDTANPVDVLRIGQGAWLRLPPGRLMRWAVLRGIGPAAPLSRRPDEQSKERLVTPGGATWNMAEMVDVDFLLISALPGILGFSGDLVNVPAQTRTRIRWFVDFFKHWRCFLSTSVAHLLTPPCPITDRAGWTAVQLQSPETTTSLVFAYHLPNDGVTRRRFPLYALHPEKRYAVRAESPDGNTAGVAVGSALMRDGVEVASPFQQHARWQGHILVIEPMR